MIDLFEHNKVAYESAVKMLSETGKAAIVHPTGTGKSFIGFKLCEDNPDATVCWLSPSEYIFQTQIENLKAASNGYAPENLVFYTYAKLMLMSEDEIAEINPDYIVLDEFHRCGAEMWGRGVQNLLNAYPAVPILGLSATAVRYLDNQRNMSEELFDGNIASEMTLGETIVRGILNPPKYVLSMFCYQKSLEKYEIRAKKVKSKPVRDAAERYLEELRRTLEKADGLDDIFAKHMDEKCGKYIVFCANKEHMDEMMSHMEWFAKVDKKPHVYSFYTNDPSASEAFQNFKADNDTNHLRLLYCIDALNEGIHMDDISGVILLRPTVSPIIYKQQIGRALSASKKKQAVIFDIVLNIENLYSIGAIEDEMQIATTYYRDLGEGERIVNERFSVIDEVRDCRILFDKLNDTLTASWDIYYTHAKEYYEENGNLEIPARYMTSDGYALGRWIFNQKGIRKGTIAGSITEEQIAKLDELGMIWGYYTDRSWERNFEAATKYYNENGDLTPPAKYITDDGIALGSWLSNLRTWERAGIHSQYLTPERVEALNRLGMAWDVIDYWWEKNYMAAVEYYKANGNLNIPSSYVNPDGVKLGSWICRLRSLRFGTRNCRGLPPTDEQIARLDRIGMLWEPRIANKWDTGFNAAKAYAKKHGDLLVPQHYVTEDGYKLRNWINRQRLLYRTDKIDQVRKQKLDSIGMVWECDTWESRFELVKQYYEKTGIINISQKEVVNGVWIGKWIRMQKQAMEAGKLSDEQVEMLKTLPIEQVGVKPDPWYKVYEDAKLYKQEHGDFSSIPKEYIGKSGYGLGNWVYTQRRLYRLGELSEDKIKLLESIDFNWDSESAWDKAYRYAKAYYEEHGDLLMKQSYKTSDGYGLGTWVYKCRLLHMQKNGLDQEQVKALDEIGMVWELESKKYSSVKPQTIKPKTKRVKKVEPKQPKNPWDVNYAVAKEYYETHGSVVGMSKKENPKLHGWLQNQRHSYRSGYLVEIQLKQLADIGIDEKWLSPQPTPFEKGYVIAKEYYELHGDLDVATNYQYTNGFWLGSWIDKIRKKKDELSDEQIALLDAIGFVWENDNWEERFALAKEYFTKNGCLPLEPKQCDDESSLRICQWLRRQLLRKNDGKMPQDQIDRLTEIGMDWLNSIERTWERGMSHARSYYSAFGHLNVAVSFVCEDGYPLGEWLHSQRTHRKRLPSDKLQALIELGASGLNV